jgi:hypothetical protein
MGTAYLFVPTDSEVDRTVSGPDIPIGRLHGLGVGKGSCFVWTCTPLDFFRFMEALRTEPLLFELRDRGYAGPYRASHEIRTDDGELLAPEDLLALLDECSHEYARIGESFR